MKHLKIFEGFFTKKKAPFRYNYNNEQEYLMQKLRGDEWNISVGMWQWGFDNKEPNLFKYVVMDEFPLLNTRNDNLKELDSFVKNTPGQIVLASRNVNIISYMVKYENIPDHLKKWFATTPQDSETKYLVAYGDYINFIGTYEDCETYISSKKYNL